MSLCYFPVAFLTQAPVPFLHVADFKGIRRGWKFAGYTLGPFPTRADSNTVLVCRVVAYEVTFVEIAGAQDNAGPKASIIYRFEILDGPKRARADVVLTYGGMEIIEQAGKDPKSAANMALHRLLRAGRDPFQSQILLQIPYGHASHFSKYGNFDSLPVLNA